MPCILWILAGMVPSSLESRRLTEFEPGRSGWSLFTTEHLQQVLQFSLPLHGRMDLRGRGYVVPSHSGHFNLFARRHQHQSRTPHKAWDVQKAVNRPWAGVIAVAVGLWVVVLDVCHSL